MITLVHGGQTGVDRGAHEAAIENGWLIAGYMPRDARDERGPIPADVARFLARHESTNYAARTEANVRASAAALIVVPNAADPRITPGTAKTIELSEQHGLRKMIVDPTTDAAQIARWIWSDLVKSQIPLPLGTHGLDPIPTRLLVAGPRESKWNGARASTVELLRRVALAITEIGRGPKNEDPLPERR